MAIGVGRQPIDKLAKNDGRRLVVPVADASQQVWKRVVGRHGHLSRPAALSGPDRMTVGRFGL